MNNPDLENLPEYFLADQERQDHLSPALIAEACIALKSNRRRYLIHKSTDEIIDALERTSEEWLDPESPFRRLALDRSIQRAGFPPEVLAQGLDWLFESLNRSAIERLLEQDLGRADRLGAFRAIAPEERERRRGYAFGPELIAHIGGGLLPGPIILSIVLGLLARSAQFMKCPTAASWIPRLFAHSLRRIEPKLACCLEIAEWPGGARPLEKALFAHADCVCVVGSDETVASVRRRVPGTTRFLGYGHRVSFAYVARELMTPRHLPRLAEAAAADVAAWNQLGCLSPHLIYVEAGGRRSPEAFAEALAGRLEELERALPRGPIAAEQAAAIAQHRNFYAVRAAADRNTRLWQSRGSTAWTVVYEKSADFRVSCLHRFIYVKAVGNLREALEGADRFRGKISTVGLAAVPPRDHALALALAQWGAPRICPLGRMQRPPLSWRHDGRPSLGDLVLWTDWELSTEW